VHTIGLGERAGERRFYRSSYPKLSSFDRAAAARWGARVAAIDRVPVARLDDLVRTTGDAEPPQGEIPAPDAIKVDAEGAEVAVLRGGRKTIESHRPLLVLEHHGDGPGDAGALRTWLRERDYRIEDLGATWICWHPESPLGLARG